MCTDKDNGKNIKTYTFTFHLHFNCCKTTKLMALKFSDFHFVSINCFVKN